MSDLQHMDMSMDTWHFILDEITWILFYSLLIFINKIAKVGKCLTSNSNTQLHVT